jgi:hypothetical protein
MMSHDAVTTTPAESPLYRFAEAVGGTIAQPESTLREIARRQEWLPALVLVLLATALSAAADVVAIASGFRSLRGGMFGLEETAAAGTLGTVLAVNSAIWSIFWGPVFWVLVTLVLFGSAWLLGGRGSFFGLLAAAGFAWTPQLLVTPVWIALEVVGYYSTAGYIAGLLVAMLLGLLAFVWTLGLLAVSVHVSMGLSGIRALMAVLVPIIAFLALGIILVCVFFAALVAVFSALS